jgi:hypothetical protein
LWEDRVLCRDVGVAPTKILTTSSVMPGIADFSEIRH